MEYITAYKCDHCGKVYQRKGAALRHELYCSQNPENKTPCYECKHLKVGRDENIKFFHCTKKDQDMHTVVALRRNLDIVESTVRTPKECELFEHDFKPVFDEL